MIVLTDDKYVKELDKIASKVEGFSLDDLKNLVFNIQDSDFEVVKTKLKGNICNFLISSEKLGFIKVDLVLCNGEINYTISDYYNGNEIDKDTIRDINGVGNYLRDNKESLEKINQEVLDKRNRDSIYHDITKKGYKFIQEFTLSDKGERVYIVRYVDIPELEERSLNLNEAVMKVKDKFDSWANEVADILSKDKKGYKLPKVTIYVEDNLDTPVEE